MKSVTRHLLMSTLLFITGWTMVQAQSNGSPSQRIALTLVDNKSTYVIEDEENHYENTLRLGQPDGPFVLTAGMLNDGDNAIILHRTDDQGGDAECAKINLTTTVTRPESKYAGIIFNGSNIPSSDRTLTTADLPDKWSTDGSHLVWQTSGSATITGKGGLVFTVPEEWDNGTIRLWVKVGTNVQGGYFSYNYNDEGWKILSGTQVSANESYTIRTFSGVKSGDVISIYGGQKNSNGTSYSSTQSPDIDRIGFYYYPATLIPTIEVNSTISYKEGETWGTASAIGSAKTYSPNDTIDLYGLGEITDVFTVSTADNGHPEYYGYKATCDANVEFPASGSSSGDFYASVDFTTATTSDPVTSAFTGLSSDSWHFYGTAITTVNDSKCFFIQYYGSMSFTVPNSFIGNSVTVSITTINDEKGARDVYVNGILHTFSAGETYSWNIPATANSTIEIMPNGSIASAYMSHIEITGGNGSSLNAPRFIQDSVNDTMQNVESVIEEVNNDSETTITIE